MPPPAPTQEVLSAQLAALPALAAVPASARPVHFPAPQAEGGRAGAARQAHALALAEARVGSRWWLPLRARMGDAGGACGAGGASAAAAATVPQSWEDGGDADDVAWRAAWARILQEEAGRGCGLPAHRGADARPAIEYSLESVSEG
jgi:hypothetical protein